MNEEFMRVSVNDREFIIMRGITETTSTTHTFKFTTEVDGNEHTMGATLVSGFSDDISAFDAEGELSDILEFEFKAEIERIVDFSV
jgi:hypothetical protein